MSDKCSNNYKDFTKSGDITLLTDCYPINSDSFKVSTDKNPINNTESCKLVNSKKSNYYKHKYDPTNIINTIETNFKDNKYKDELINNLKQTFDLEPRDNCCNCISISLYFLEDIVSGYLKYLSSIDRTIKNVAVCLPDYIVRVYMDGSVYNQINQINDELSQLQQEINDIEKIGPDNYDEQTYKKLNFYEDRNRHLLLFKEIFDSIINAPNCEIYTYYCDSIIDKQMPITRTRTFRFLPFSDPDVNISIIREADGSVTNMDCYNINIFEKSDKIFYFLTSFGIYEADAQNNYELTLERLAYSKWLYIYKYLSRTYFEQKQNIVDLLAGLFAIKLKVKKSVYEQINKETTQLINISKVDSELYYGMYIYDESLTDTTVSMVKKTLNIGYDEILLLHLFREIISVRYSLTDKKTNKINYDPDHYELIASLYDNLNSRLEISERGIISFINNKVDQMNSYDYYYKHYGSYDEEVYGYLTLYCLDALILPKNIKDDKNEIIDIYYTKDIKMSLLANRPYMTNYNDYEIHNTIYTTCKDHLDKILKGGLINIKILNKKYKLIH